MRWTNSLLRCTVPSSLHRQLTYVFASYNADVYFSSKTFRKLQAFAVVNDQRSLKMVPLYLCWIAAKKQYWQCIFVYSSSRAAKRVLFPFCSKVLKNKLETLELDKMHFDKLPFLLCTMSLCVKNQTKIEGTFRNGLTGAWDTVTQRCGDQACCVWLLR